MSSVPVASLTAKGRLVLFAGQSNMLGHTKATDGDKTSHRDVYAWDNNGTAGRWHPAELGKAPFNQAKDAPNNAAYHFGAGLAKVTSQSVYLLGCPVNGSSICAWRDAASVNMKRLIEQVSFALETEMIQTAGIDHIDTMLWHQGETDDPGATMVKDQRLMCLEDYQKAFHTMIETLQAQPWWRPATRLIAGQLVHDGWLSARNDFYQNPGLWPADLPMAVVPSQGLGHIGDRAHFTGVALQHMGELMLEAHQTLQAQCEAAQSA